MKKEKNKYFEGWYFKHESENAVIALIPGISCDAENKHAFIQLIANTGNLQNETKYFSFPIEKYHASTDKLDITIDKNRFTPYGIDINITQDNYVLKGKISFGHFAPLRTSLLHPTIMGFFSYFPNMKCNHGVVSMRHSVHGYFTINNISYTFSSGLGYIERDWGKSFPSKYFWIQCSNFGQQKISFMMSYAKLKICGIPFNGLICALKFDNTELIFGTYNGSTTKILSHTPNSIEVLIKKSSYKLYIKASSLNSGNLLAPISGKMSRTISESISCSVSLKLIHKNKTLFESVGSHGGLEINL